MIHGRYGYRQGSKYPAASLQPGPSSAETEDDGLPVGTSGPPAGKGIHVFKISEQERSASRRLHEHLRASRVGQRWERIFRAQEPEIEGLLAIHPDVRQHVSDALQRIADAAVADGPVDEDTLRAVAQVLDDLDRLGGIELRRAAESLRDELELLRGHSLSALLASNPGPPQQRRGRRSTDH